MISPGGDSGLLAGQIRAQTVEKALKFGSCLRNFACGDRRSQQRRLAFVSVFTRLPLRGSTCSQQGDARHLCRTCTSMLHAA